MSKRLLLQTGVPINVTEKILNVTKSISETAILNATSSMENEDGFEKGFESSQEEEPVENDETTTEEPKEFSVFFILN